MKSVLAILVLSVCAIGCSDPDASKQSIWEAAQNGDIKTVQEHIDAGVDVNAKGERVWMEATPLHHAVKGGHLNIVELLIENGADVNARGIEVPLGSQVTPLDIATESGNEVVIELLRANGGELSS